MTKINKKDLPNMIELYLNGHSAKEIGLKFNISRIYVIYLLKKNSEEKNYLIKEQIRRNKSAQKISDLEINKIIKDILSQKKIREIADNYKVSSPTIYRIVHIRLQKMGYPLSIIENLKGQLSKNLSTGNKSHRVKRRNNGLPLGVNYHKKRNRYVASTYRNGKRINIGCYKNVDDAHNAYLNKIKEFSA